jgi:hypothetical protein
MQKTVRPQWILQALADAERERIAPGLPITVVVSPVGEKAERDKKRPSVGYAPWRCTYHVAPDKEYAQAIVPFIDQALARWRERFDVGVTFNEADHRLVTAAPASLESDRQCALVGPA